MFRHRKSNKARRVGENKFMSRATKLLAGLGLAAVPAAGLLLYHKFVEQKMRENFAQLSAGNYEAVLKQMAPRFDHFFSGTHSLGGRPLPMDACFAAKRSFNPKRGVVPDVVVNRRVADYVTGRDGILETALNLIK